MQQMLLQPLWRLLVGTLQQFLGAVPKPTINALFNNCGIEADQRQMPQSSPGQAICQGREHLSIHNRIQIMWMERSSLL